MRPTILLLLLLILAPTPTRADLPSRPPASLGLDPSRLARLDAIIDRAIADKSVPGAVVLVGRHGAIAYARTSGLRAIAPQSEPMTRDTRFDLASLTKPIATATSIMILIERGKLHLDDPLAKLLPEFDNHGKGAITLDQLLRHRTGLIADNPIADYADGPEIAWKNLANLDLKSEPGKAYVYSDVNFEILGRIVEKASGQPLNEYAEKNIFKPLGMSHTSFNPSDPANIAPTEPSDGKMLRGIIHDPRSRALGGVAGHAGLFSDADDLAIYASTLLNGGLAPNGHRLFSPLTVRLFTDPAGTPPRQRRALGWDVDTPHSAPRGTLFPKTGYGHTGFTGTSLWIDPESDTFIVILTSRLHPDGKGESPTLLRSQAATAVAAAIKDASPRPAPESPVHPVLCGIDALARDGFAPLKNKRVGLITNHTGLTVDGRPTIDVLFKAPGVNLIALFSPEHGIRGAVDAEVADSRDDATGLPVHSLYGKTRKPTPESLANVDVLVYDIQDIGCRFYTYISTLGLALEAAAQAKIPLIVLDRPNPIGGVVVSGPIRDDQYASFIAHHALPVRHGLTVGELARLFNAERQIHADLSVIPCEGWSRADLYDRTGLLWVNPSPNMRSLNEALLYPGVGLLEATNLATGRGTDTPFERLGAPWIDPIPFASALNAQSLPGLAFTPIRFSPTERQYKGESCGGVYISITNRDLVDPILLGLTLAHVLRTQYKDHWKPDPLKKFLCDDPSYNALLDGLTPRAVETLYQSKLKDFLRTRARYLLYP